MQECACLQGVEVCPLSATESTAAETAGLQPGQMKRGYMNTVIRAALLGVLLLAAGASGAFAGENAGSAHARGGYKRFGYKNSCEMCHRVQFRKKMVQRMLSDAANTEMGVKSDSALPLFSQDTLMDEREQGFNGMTEDPSKICLECHDGIQAQTVHITIGTGRHLGTGSHPIGVDYERSRRERPQAQLRSSGSFFPQNGKGVRIADVLWKGRILTCTSCHDPHGTKSVRPEPGQRDCRLYAPERRSAICLGCHDFGSI